jgi:RimJ/RimL family protein N-acetyltransferase
VIAREGGLAIRRMRDEPGDYELVVRWRNEPHVREWWDPDDPPLTSAQAIEEYRPETRADSSTTACIIEEEGVPVGYIQFYPWAAEPEEVQALELPVDANAWGIDVFIGEPSHLGRGVGTRAVDLVARHLFSQRGASSVALLAAKANAHALRAYEKAGFRRTIGMLDLDVKDGERVDSWLMVRAAPTSA